MQPTTACNLNCSYCYLPERHRAQVMSVGVAESVAKSVALASHRVDLLWHGGEPLAVGLTKFRSLCSPFAALRDAGRIRHSLQTNGTLLNDAWCDFLVEERFRVGVSVDGPAELNASRVGWAGAPAFGATMRGIELLRRRQLPFGVIAVVNPHNVSDPVAFYDFFRGLGCDTLNINIAEREGANAGAHDLPRGDVESFWSALFAAWRQNPSLRVREFDHVLGWAAAVLSSASESVRQPPSELGPAGRRRDMWPTVSRAGDVVVLSPELASAPHLERARFVVGNVLTDELHVIVRRGLAAWYVKEFRAGRRECEAHCQYFSFCGGGHASNKFFELGSFRGTETAHCRNSRQTLVDAVLASVVQEPVSLGFV